MRVGGLKVISFTVTSTAIQLFQKTPNKMDFFFLVQFTLENICPFLHMKILKADYVFLSGFSTHYISDKLYWEL